MPKSKKGSKGPKNAVSRAPARGRRIEIVLAAESDSPDVVRGKAVCGRCRLKIDRPCHVAVYRDVGDKQRQVFSLLPSARLAQIEKKTGRCPGTHEVEVRGHITEYRGSNYLQVADFRIL